MCFVMARSTRSSICLHWFSVLVFVCHSSNEDKIPCPDVAEYLHLNEDSDTKQYYCAMSGGNKQENSSGFVCQSEGQFADVNDTTCLRYFQCDRLNDGTFSKKSLECIESVFCPSTQICTPKDLCPCGHTTTNESLSTSKPSITAVPNPCTSTSHVDFKCNSVGRFPNFNDRTCQAYFLCSYLQNGSFIKTEYTCRNSFFDPDIKRCTLTYVCPCAVSETTTTDQIANTLNTTTSHVVNVTTPTTITEFLTTQPGCTISSKEFECVLEGRFPNYADISCRKYFLCSKLRNGTFIKTQYQCMQSTFNPLTYRCSSSYICPCSTLSTLTTLSYANSTVASTVSTSIDIPSTTGSTIGCKIFNNGDHECVTSGRFPDNSDVTCTKYFLCSKLNNGTFIKTSYKCLNSAFHPLILKCSTSYVCPCNVDDTSVATTPTTVSEAHTTPSIPTTTMSHTCISSSKDVPEFTCKQTGRYPDYTDFSCKKYFLCSKLQNGTFIKTVYACLNSVFDPSILKCSISYKCPCKIYITSTTSSTTLTEGVTSAPTTTTPSYICHTTAQNVSEFNCGLVGRFPDFTDSTCTRYFLCSKLLNGTFIKTPYICRNSVFDPSTSRCSISYECPCKIETTSVTTPLTTLSEGVTPIFTTTTKSYTCSFTSQDDSEFSCAITGRFPDFTDIKCAKYFLCSKLRNGTFIRTEYTCLNSAFDPSILRCSLSYKCPCTIDTTSPSSITTTISYNCLTTSHDVSEFTCSNTGRFPDYTDVNCRKYFLCSKLQNGTFIRTQYTCLNSTFDPSTYRCSISYDCPCKITDNLVII
ncbi:hypothetical protein ILUMI_08633 [Ignelater luminosus]|uniref:Chitin-binding type-2 domain-containing protein n=1 Tax=Ignelater luminosus TaxID=2038154 RepID=A0A8K0GFS3_IGNLU|nr:hypothetical protein ILUMI_08633 [Ignelater luminosus]